jgi:hypothetical protein
VIAPQPKDIRRDRNSTIDVGITAEHAEITGSIVLRPDRDVRVRIRVLVELEELDDYLDRVERRNREEDRDRGDDWYRERLRDRDSNRGRDEMWE